MKLFLYRRIKKYVETMEVVSAAVLQIKFEIGYAKATEMLDRLSADGKIRFASGRWVVLRGERDGIVTEESDFTEENVLKLLDDNGFLTAAVIQRRFEVGYARATQMIEMLEDKGHVRRSIRWVKTLNTP